MATHDTTGRAYARLAEIKAGDILEADEGFGCVEGGVPLTVMQDEIGLYVCCDEGHHYLDGQADDGEHCVGMYRPRDAA